MLPSERAVAAEISGPSFVTLEYLCEALDKPQGGLLEMRVRRRTIIRALRRLIDFGYLLKLIRVDGRVLYAHKALWDTLPGESRNLVLLAPVRKNWNTMLVVGSPQTKENSKREVSSQSRGKHRLSNHRRTFSR